MLAALSSIAGILCKEMMASVPAMVLLYEWTFIKGGVGERLKTSWPLYIALALGWIPIAVIYQAGYTTPLAGFNNTISAVDWWMTQANAFFRVLAEDVLSVAIGSASPSANAAQSRCGVAWCGRTVDLRSRHDLVGHSQVRDRLHDDLVFCSIVTDPDRAFAVGRNL